MKRVKRRPNVQAAIFVYFTGAHVAGIWVLGKWLTNQTIKVSFVPARGTGVHRSNQQSKAKVCCKTFSSFNESFWSWLEMKIERAVDEGSTWNYTTCAGLWWKLDVFFYNDVLLNICGGARLNSRWFCCRIHFRQCRVKSDLAVGSALIDEICACQGHVLKLLERRTIVVRL